MSLQYAEAKNVAFKYVVYRRRTVSEVKEKLKKLEVSDEIIDKVIEELICFEYLDDKKYAQKFIEKNKKESISSLKFKLMSKGIEKEIIEECFNDISFDETEKVLALLRKRKYSNELDDKQKDKIKAYCVRKGFKIFDIEKAIKML